MENYAPPIVKVPNIPPLASEIRTLLHQAGAAHPRRLKSREECLEEFRARVAKRAARKVPGHVLALADRMVIEARAPHSANEGQVIQWCLTLGRAIKDAEHVLAHACLLRGEDWRYEVAAPARALCDRLTEVLACIIDQTHAAEEESEAKRKPIPPAV